MITYEKFKELFDSLDSSRHPEIEFFFKNYKESYIMVKFENYISFGNSTIGTFEFKTLDELYNSNINGLCLKNDWHKINDIYVDMTFSVKDKNEIKRQYGVELTSIKEKYIQTFFKSISKTNKQKIYFEKFMWHAFSYEKIPHYQGIHAIECLNKIKKNQVYIIFQHSDIILEEKNITYNKLYNMIMNDEIEWDCYVIDKDFKWTFVMTHEIDLDGPPFGLGPYYTDLEIIENQEIKNEYK